jgi:transcriptional regulator with XRE-family HTH domain
MGNTGVDSVGLHIRAWRKSRGLSQEALARRCGWVNQSRVSHYETGVHPPGLDDLRAISKALAVELSMMLTTLPAGSSATGEPPIEMVQEEPAAYADPVRSRYEAASPLIKQVVDALLLLAEREPTQASKIAKAMQSLLKP